MTEDSKRVCPTCLSQGFEESVLGSLRCEFCDGTAGGNPPTLQDIERARLDNDLEAIAYSRLINDLGNQHG